MITNLNAIVTTVGLVFDIVGAVLVAFEVVSKFKGTQFVVGQTYDEITSPPKKTEIFEKWEQRKYSFMSCGLAALLIGFLLQAVGTWLPIWCSSPSTSITLPSKTGTE